MIFFQSSFRLLISFLFLLVLVQAASIFNNNNNSKGHPSDQQPSNHDSNPVTPLKKLFKEEGRGLARIDATLKQFLGNPLTGIVYAASLAIGAISLLAMYESPLSPLPVPSLPKPPVGRFPPEHPVWPPVSKHPVKLRQHQQGPQMQYAASNMNPVFEMAPQFANIGKQQLVSYEESNNWLSPQNLVPSYGPGQQQLGNGNGANPMASSSIGSALAPPRRSDYTIQPYQSSKMHLPLNHNWKQQQPAQPQNPNQGQAVVATPSQPALVSPSDAVGPTDMNNNQPVGSSSTSMNQEVVNANNNNNSNNNSPLQGSSSGLDYNMQPEQQQ